MELLMAYAKGKHAKFISDRSGLEFPYTEMVTEWNGMKVHTSEYEDIEISTIENIVKVEV